MSAAGAGVKLFAWIADAIALVRTTGNEGPMRETANESAMRALQRIHTAVAALVAEREWRPISEAPKDGTPILACYAPHYTTNGFLPVAVRWRTYHPNAKGKEEWRDSSGNKVRALTHWMPLPPPPTTGDDHG